MKTAKLFIFVLLVIPLSASAQTKVKGSDIIRQINQGKIVSYKSAEIIGKLDFTSVEDVELYRFHRRDRNYNFGSTDVFFCHIKVPVLFIDCIFADDVFAYVHDDWENATYNAVFHENASFIGCEFKRESAFKYAKFLKNATFKNTTFERDALFKYTKFVTPVNFARAHFGDDANFKYTKFRESVDFEGAIFRRPANFKYTKFPRGVSFANADFQRLANFKYANFYEPLNFDGCTFDEVDFKYTEVEGEAISSYLMSKVEWEKAEK